MKRKKVAIITTIALMIGIIGGVFPKTAFAGQEQETVNFQLDWSAKTKLENAKQVGVNIEMSTISDEMWNTNGQWMKETFNGAQVPIMRWGYDAWVFDWENEVPLLPDKYWGGNNSKDAAGTFGLYEFAAYCKENDVIPFVDIPIESHNHKQPNQGPVTLEDVKRLTQSMAIYLNQQGIEQVYFDMGNEPWSSKSNKFGSIPARYYGSLFQEFQPIIKAVNPNYKLVLQHAPDNILWLAWNNRAEAEASGYFDAYDDHQYYFTDWNKFYDKNNDDFFKPGKSIDGVEALMGECNISWTNKIWPHEWEDGHTRDLGSSLALLNAFLDIVNKDSYQQVVTWPSHYPSKDSIEWSTNHPFGWFNIDQWDINRVTERISGPVIAHTIVNQNILDYKIDITSDNPKVRCFGYTNADNSVLKVILVNKLWHDHIDFNFDLGQPFDRVNAMVMKGNRTGQSPIHDRNPVYQSHITNQSVCPVRFSDCIPYGESAIVYTFYQESGTDFPQAFDLIGPVADEQSVSTSKCFQWQEAVAATDYHLRVSKNSDLSSPVIDTRTGGQTSYQWMRDLELGQTYYWTVWAENRNGTTPATDSIRSFTTFAPTGTVINDSSDQIVYNGSWNGQTSIGCYQNDDHSCNVAGDWLELAFTGQKVTLYGIRGNWCGKIDVYLDDVLMTEVDTYSPAISTQQPLFTSSELEWGDHILRVVVKGTKRPESEGAWFEFDKIKVE